MILNELVDHVADRVTRKAGESDRGLVKRAAAFVFVEIADALRKNEEVVVRDFGKFYPRLRKSRLNRGGLFGGKAFRLPEQMQARFWPAAALNERMNPKKRA